MALSLVLLALSGAASHIHSTPGLWHKARLALSLAYLFGKEIVGIAALLPLASRSYLIYSLLPSHPPCHLQLTAELRITPHSRGRRLCHWHRAAVARNLRYGDAERNLLDVYVPLESSPGQRPVIMFVHGGIWASGNKELFANVGACLAHYGVVTVVIQYTLFPKVLASEQVTEVSKALSWVFDNVAHYGGDPSRVTLMGHSAGGHLAAMVLCERLRRQREASTGRTEEAADLRQPCNFIGLSGVYDIAEHLKYEMKRGVDSMSCMTPAMGGRTRLEAMSPVRLLRLLVEQNEDLHCAGEAVRPVVHGDEADAAIKSEVVFPSCTLFCSRSDAVVPATTSLALNDVLLKLGFESRVVLYEHLLHGEFVILDGAGVEFSSLSQEVLRISAFNS